MLNLGARWKWVVDTTPRPHFTPGKEPWNALNTMFGGPQGRFGRFGEETIFARTGMLAAQSL